MGFSEAVKSVYSQYFGFSGRARRSEYWWFILFTVIASFLLGFIDWMITGGILGGIFSLGSLIPSIAVAMRRLHDIGRSGWWFLIIFIPLIGFLVFLYFAVQPGKSGPNDYGADPKS